MCRHIDIAQEALGRTMLFENPSVYLRYDEQEMAEWEFLSAMTRRTGCGLLLDVNNVYVSSCNLGLDAEAFLRGMPADRIRQIHLAGHTKTSDLLIDTHDKPVCEDVWALYRDAITMLGPIATMIERDDDIPPLATLLNELDIARDIARARRQVSEAA